MNKRIMSSLLAVLLIIGFIPKMNIANAVEIESIELGDLEGGAQSTTGAQVTVDYNEDGEELEDGLYSVDYSAYKDGTNESSSAGSSIVESKLKVKNGKKSVLITFKNASMLSKLSARVNGEEESISQTETVENQFTIEFKIDSLEDKINLGLSVTIPTGLVMNHTFDFVINDVTFKEAIEDEDVDNNDTTMLKDGKYTVDTNILKTGTNETSVASAYLEKESNLKVKNGQYILTLNIKDIKVMSNIKVTVDGKNAEIDSVRNNDGTGSISFNINSLSSNILVACNVSVPQIGYNSNVDFNVALDTSTIKDENGGGIELPDENNAGVPLYKNATYTIENEINTENMPESASYLDPKSIIEVEDGYIYLTLSFNMSGFMDSRYIKLNDNSSVTRYTVVNDNNRSVIRFKISSLSDKIHISSKNKSIDEGFTIALLKETLVQKATEPQKESDDEDEDDNDEDYDDLDDGTYTIKNKALKENSNATSDARAYLDDESIITVKNGKIYITLKFTHGKMMSDTSIKVQGKKTSYTTVKKSGNKFYIKFKIGSLSDEVLVTSTIDTGIPAIGTIKGTKFRVLLRESTLEEDDDADEDDEDDEEDTDEEKSNSSVDSVISNSTSNTEDIGKEVIGSVSQNSSDSNNGAQYKKATYKVNNEIVTDSAIGYQAARGAINKVSYFEIENDTKNYITLGFNQTDIMDNIRLQINGNKVDYEIINQDKNNKTMAIRFPIQSISTEVTVTTTITAMGRDTSFGVKFLESTLELISTEKNDSEIINNQVAGKLSSVANTESNVLGSKLDLKSAANNVSDADVEVVLENSDITSEAKEYFKRYTINNEVLSDSSMGRMMARKYLNETSIIEEIDGNLYATITFSSASSMGNFKIEVGGKEVQHSVVLKDESNGLISLRFPITNVNDDIRVYIYINPMKMNIDFGIKFLQDTMILIEEGTVGSEGTEGSEEKTTGLIENLAAINKENSNNNNISTWKIVVFTSVLSTILNFSVGGIIYLIIRKRRNNKKINTNN